MKRGFTLIELLVVIAIIAILAAILFPVFAQAKASAKRIASLSNVKQNGLAVIMYNADYDDVMPPVVSWALNGAPATVAGAGYQPWSWVVLPYIKTGDLYMDPQAPANKSWPAGWPATATKALAPQYGYNYTWLSPVTGDPFVITPVSATAVAQVADTVMLAAKFSTGEHSLSATGFYWAGPGSWATTLTIEGPECFTIPSWCFVNWGVGSWYDTDYLMGNDAAGAKTGGVSFRTGEKAITVWVDGHATSESKGALARGTNWTPTIAEGDLVFTDVTQYRWDIQ